MADRQEVSGREDMVMRINNHNSIQYGILLLLLSSTLLIGCQKNDVEVTTTQQTTEESGLEDGRTLVRDEVVSIFREHSVELLWEKLPEGITAQLTDVVPSIMYLGTENGAVTEIYDVYKAYFTSPSGVKTERYTIIYYRNVEISEGEPPVVKYETPYHIGIPVEVSATPEDGGFITGYKSKREMEKDVLESMETAITHVICEE